MSEVTEQIWIDRSVTSQDYIKELRGLLLDWLNLDGDKDDVLALITRTRSAIGAD